MLMLLSNAIVVSLYIYVTTIILLPFLDAMIDTKKCIKRLTLTYFIVCFIVGLVNFKILLGSIAIFMLESMIFAQKFSIVLISILGVLLLAYIVKDLKSIKNNRKDIE